MNRAMMTTAQTIAAETGQIGQRIADACRQSSSRLQAGDQEHEAFGQVNQEVPEENALQPRRRADQPQTIPADIKTGGHGGEHAGAAQVLAAASKPGTA